MKRLIVVVAALVIVLAVAGGTATAGKGKKKKPLKVETQITLQIDHGSAGDAYTPPGKARYSGTVSAGRPFCVQDRQVFIHFTGKGEPGITLTTDSKGNYAILVDEPIRDGEYRARALKKKKEGSANRWRNGVKMICRTGRSNKVTVF